MDKITHEVRLSQWKAIIEQCQARPEGVSAKKWLEDNGIKNRQYYYWLRRVRKEAYEQASSAGLLPAAVKSPENEKNEEITFAEIHTLPSANDAAGTDMFRPDVIISTKAGSIAVSNTVSPELISVIIREVANAG